MPSVDPLARHDVQVTGDPDARVMMFAAGFGGTKDSWRFVAPAFAADHRVVLFDHIGTGGADPAAYDRVKYDSLHGYADDVIEILDALGARDVVFVGHSVSGMIGLLAAVRRPELFGQLVLLGPSPRYVDADGYSGGFTREGIDALLDALDSNYLSWSSALSTTLVGNADAPGLTDSLAAQIAAADPSIASHFARVTFLSDNRRDLADVTTPTLILQSVEDNIASPAVGAYVHAQVPGSALVVIPSRGHVPHLSDPDEVVQAIRTHLG